VRAVRRGGVTEVPEGVERVVAHVGTSVGARRACEGAAVVYHCAQPDYRKWRELFTPMTQAILRIAGLFNPFLRELSETLYQFERPFVSDASKFQGAFGPFEPTPHPQAVRRTVDWFRRRSAVER
jgi:hypothetical protein